MRRKRYFWERLLLSAIGIFIFSQAILFAQNTDLPVGAIPGTIDVSPMGVATYTIPIEVVPGTQEVQPNLSIVYNSQSGMGLLGMKWHLGGLSSITRIGQSLYYDNNTTGVQLNGEDRFALDGNRLIMINGSVYGAHNTTYAFETEDFTRVVYHNTNSVDYFTATLDGGTKVEYGKEFGSRQLLENKTLSWMVSKITDPYGNYMTFHYEQYHGEIWITQIKYTGNDAAWMNTYSHVRFYYTENEVSKNTAFIGGEEIFNTKLLERISVSYDYQLVREYQFSYEQDKNPHLTEIAVIGEDSTALNPTLINWGERVNSVSIESLTSLVNGKTLAGDFNGDGHCDIILYGLDVASNLSTAKWKLYLGDSNGNFTYKSEQTYLYSAAAARFRVGDFDGNGTDDLLIAAYSFINTPQYYTCKIFNFDSSGTVSSSLPIGSYPFFNEVYLGDFDGDEKCDILILKVNPICDTMLLTQFYGINPLNLSFHINSRFHITDFDGDGKSNIQVTHKTCTRTYKYVNINNTRYFTEISQSGFPNQWHYTYYGDFNGDGKEDVLTFDKENKLWKLWLHKGNDSYTWPAFVFPLNILNTELDTYEKKLKYDLFIVDINGDGKDDIMQFTPSGNSTSGNCLRVLISESFFSGEYHYSYSEISHSQMFNTGSKTTFNIGDFNGDGILDLMHKSSVGSYPIIIFFNKGEQYEFVKTIVEGHQNEIQLTYIPHTVLAIKVLAPDYKKRILSYVVNKLTYSNGIQGADSMNTILYEYNTAGYYSPNRKTYLGPSFYSQIYQQKDVRIKKEYFVDYHKDMSRLFSVKHTNVNQTQIFSTQSIGYELFPNEESSPYVLNISSNTITNYLKGEKVKTDIELNSQGRIKKKTVQNQVNSNFLTKEETEFTYTNVILPNGHLQYLPQNVKTKTYQNNSSVLFLLDIISYTYSDGKPNTITQSGRTTTYSHYNLFGKAQKETITCAQLPALIINYQYDSRGRFLTGKSNSLGHSAHYTYNGKYGNLLTKQDINNLTTTYEYDAFGREQKIIYPDSVEDHFSSDWYSSFDIPNAIYHTTFSSTGSKPSITTYYDKLGREVCRKEGNRYTQTVYDRFGNVIAVSLPNNSLTDPNIIWRNYVYDHHGRKTQETGPYTDISYTYSPTTTTMTDNLRNITYTRQYDAAGRLISATDPGGTVSYVYSLVKDDGNITRSKTQISLDDQITVILTDHRGNRILITEPNAGTITSQYNTLGELIRQEDANGNVTTYEYDQLGRVVEKIISNGNHSDTLSYEYDFYSESQRGRGKLRSIKRNNVSDETYIYDPLGRLLQKRKFINGKQYHITYAYNDEGKLDRITYPNRFSIQYYYNSNGEISEIRNYDNASLIYKIYHRNALRQPTLSAYGNGIATRYTYNDYGLLTQIKTGEKIYERGDPSFPSEAPFEPDNAYQDLQYTYNNLGLMSSRSNAKNNQSESFFYDNLDRLTYYGRVKKIPIGGTADNIFYDAQGNITSTPYTGSYSYEINTTKPHAVEQVTLTSANSTKISPSDCAVEYTMFNKAKTITEDDWHLELVYGADQQREKTILKHGDAVVKTKYFVGDLYEQIITSEDTSHLNYIYAGNRLVAIVKESSFKIDPEGPTTPDEPEIPEGPIIIKTSANPIDNGIYYIHTDHLGSYNLITDAGKNRIDSLHFDPWGNRMKYHTWTLPDTGRTFFSDRGFTGHEHLDQFKIINMNGRLYDPVIARFFSPDPFVQMPDFTQSYNRYSYCLNNPLHFTDPTGEKLKWWQWALIGLGADVMTGGAISTSILGAAGTVSSVAAGVIGDPVSSVLSAGISGLTVAGATAGIGIGNGLANMTFAGIGYVFLGDFGTRVGNAWKLSWGMFKTDKELNFFERYWQFMSRYTYEMPITAFGQAWHGFANAFSPGDVNVGYFHGATVLQTDWMDNWGAVTVGSNITMGYNDGDIDANNLTLLHEYGHYLQTRTYGGMSWYNMAFSSITTPKEIPHMANWSEQDANYRSMLYFRDKISSTQYNSFSYSYYGQYSNSYGYRLGLGYLMPFEFFTSFFWR